MNNVSLESLTSNATAHLSVACLFCYWLLHLLEPRRLARFPRLVLTTVAVALYVRLLMHTEVPIQRWLWTICGVISLIAALHTIFQWTKVLPSEIYDEEKQKNVKKSKLAEDQKALPAKLLWHWGSKLGLICTLVALGSLVYIRFSDLSLLPGSLKYFAALQQIGISLMLGVAMFLSIELTFISSPDALSVQRSARVHWPALASVTMFIALTILACCLAQFMAKVSAEDMDSTQRTVHFAARAFGLIMLVATFVVWIIPRRLASFQKSGKIPSDWISLTLTAWLGMFAFVVAATLPADWPWKLLGK